jgi:hypothetical protein
MILVKNETCENFLNDDLMEFFLKIIPIWESKKATKLLKMKKKSENEPSKVACSKN